MTWTLHTSIPDLRGVKYIYGEVQLRAFSLEELAERNKILITPSDTSRKIFLTNAGYHGWIGEDIVINEQLIREVVGTRQKAIDGLIAEFLAYGFFDKQSRETLKQANRSSSDPFAIFAPKTQTVHESETLREQWLAHLKR